MENASIFEPAILIRISKSYEPVMSETALYEATRGTWVLGPRKEKARLAMAVVHGLIVGVYEIGDWHQAGTTPYATRRPGGPEEAAQSMGVHGPTLWKRRKGSLCGALSLPGVLAREREPDQVRQLLS